MTQEKMDRLLNEAGIAETFKSCTFSSFNDWDARVTRAKNIARKFVSDCPIGKDQNSLAILGAVGCGKTMLGAATLNELMGNGISVLYIHFLDLMKALKAFAADSDGYQHEIEKYIKPSVLMIDDLYKGYTENDIKYIYDIINRRYFARKSLIITSELTAAQMCDIDEATGSRIVEMCKNYIYELRGTGLNYRLRGLT